MAAKIKPAASRMIPPIFLSTASRRPGRSRTVPIPATAQSTRISTGERRLSDALASGAAIKGAESRELDGHFKGGRDRFHKAIRAGDGKMFPAEFMRLLNTIFSALSLFLLLVVAFFWVRSYWRFDGILRYSEGTPITLETSLKGRTFKVELPGRSAGLISYRGQMAYVSVATPIGEPWESWSVPVEATTGTGPAALVSDVRVHTGLRYGSDQTRSELLDPTAGFSWHLPY